VPCLIGVGEGALLGILFALLFGIFFSGPDFGGLLRYSVAMRSRRGDAASRVSAGALVARQRTREPGEIKPSSRARSTASLRLCASSFA
jgi:hypothetical protein